MASSASRWSFKIATVRGIPIRLHTSFILLMVFVFWRTGTTGGLQAAALQQAFLLAVFGCVALHELGHAAAALRNGVPISGITLYPFGGLARMAQRPPHGRVEVAIALAGPMVNLGIAVILLVVSLGTILAPGSSLPLRLLSYLFWANVLLAGFNLLPIFPLDGGRVLRGVLSPRIGWVRATVWAASAGQVAGAVLIVVGVIHDAWLVLAGILILPGANSELRFALAARHLSDRRVIDLARTKLLSITDSSTVSVAVGMSEMSPLSDLLVVNEGGPTAYLSAPRLWAHVRSGISGDTRVSEVALRFGRPIRRDTTLDDAVRSLEADGAEVAPVVDTEGEIVGVVSLGDLRRADQLAGSLFPVDLRSTGANDAS
jgi:Zn-dependent protease/CBS domain-containing protein